MERRERIPGIGPAPGVSGDPGIRPRGPGSDLSGSTARRTRRLRPPCAPREGEDGASVPEPNRRVRPASPTGGPVGRTRIAEVPNFGWRRNDPPRTGPRNRRPEYSHRREPRKARGPGRRPGVSRSRQPAPAPRSRPGPTGPRPPFPSPAGRPRPETDRATAGSSSSPDQPGEPSPRRLADGGPSCGIQTARRRFPKVSPAPPAGRTDPCLRQRNEFALDTRRKASVN